MSPALAFALGQRLRSQGSDWTRPSFALFRVCTLPLPYQICSCFCFLNLHFAHITCCMALRMCTKICAGLFWPMGLGTQLEIQSKRGSCKLIHTDPKFMWSSILFVSRFCTDSSIPGVERLVISSLRKQHGLEPKFELTTQDISVEADQMLAPHGCFIVKGWSRALAATTILLAAYEDDAFFQAR